MTPTLARAGNVRLAVAVILLTNLALSLGDAVVKQISPDFVLWQIFAQSYAEEDDRKIPQVKSRSKIWHPMSKRRRRVSFKQAP